MTDEKLCPDCGRPGGFAQGECATYASCVAATRVECDTLTITRLRAENARLSEEVARLKAERQWIPVGERMPPTGLNVLVPGGLAFFDGIDWRTMTGDASGRRIQWEVTHWMPQPKDPL